MRRAISVVCASSLAIVVVCSASTSVAAQQPKARKLGPDTVKSIQDAKLDPAFQTTKKDRLVLLPFANTAEFGEAASVISKNLVAQLAQKHPEYAIVPPDELINFISTAKLDDQFNVFLGDYLTAGVARQDFLTLVSSRLNADGVLVGKILGYGETKTAGPTIFRARSYVVGMEMAWYRVNDGRRIWWGKDTIDAQKATNLQAAAEAIAEVFARFVGRTAYQ